MTVDLTQYDAEVSVPGQYISPTWDKDPDEDHVSETLANLFIAGVVAAKLVDWTGLAKRWTERGYDAEHFHRTVTDRFVHVLRQSAGAMLMRAAGLGRAQALADFQAEFPPSEWERIASTWSQVYGHEMAVQVANQSERGVALLVPQLINRGMRGEGLGAQVRALYGLDPRSMQGAVNFLVSDKKPRDKTILDLATSFLTRRAKVIGDVQAFTGLNFGRQLTYMEAMDRGLLPKSARKVWVTAIDERVCKVCKPMDGVTVGLMDTFAITMSNGNTIRLLVPPVHPNCRCTVVPEERYRHGIITRTARFRDEGPTHRGRLVSEIEDLVGLGKNLHPESQEVEKFSPLQARDALGRFAPVAGALAAGTALAATYPKVKNESPRLPRHLRRVDRKVKALKGGTYLIPRQYLDFHQRGQSFRVGQASHINDMARHIRRNGYQMQPITLHVYDDVVEVADGNHRVEAAYRARLGFVPTKVVRFKGKKPTQRGVVAAWRQHRTNEARNQAAARYVGALDERRRNPFRTLNQRLISQDEKKHQWHKTRHRTVKPLMVNKLFDPSETRDAAGKWTAGAGRAIASHSDDVVSTALLGAGLAAFVVPTLKNPAVRSEVLEALNVARNGTEVGADEAAKFVRVFDGFSHGGYSAAATTGGVHRTSQGVQVTGWIKGSDGELVGQFIRHFKRNGTVDHSLFAMDDAHQGAGFGSAFITHSFDEYRKMGYKAVSVHANIDVGGYTWASMGFKFQRPKNEMGVIRSLERSVSSTQYTEDEIYQMKRAAEDMRHGRDITPQDIIKIGLDRVWKDAHDRDMWAGKHLMLGTDWYGVFTL